MMWLALFSFLSAFAAGPTWNYVVKETGEALEVSAKYPGKCPESLFVEAGGAPFVKNLKKTKDGANCSTTYRFDLAAAAETLGDAWLAGKFDGLTYISPALFLMRPPGDVPGARLRFKIDSKNFATGIYPTKDKAAFELELDRLDDVPYLVFGPMRKRTITMKAGEVVIAISPGQYGLTDDELVEWIGQGARAIEAYYAKIPVPHVLVLIRPVAGSGLEEAKTFGDGGSLITLQVGREAKKERLMHGWVLPHEMVHLTFPEIGYRYHWVHEGLATYVEPLARLKIGNISAVEVWGDLIDGLPKGAPRVGDRGLDGTEEWGRLYWGGALYWLLCDVEIHKRSKNKLALEDALRAINKAGGNNSASWTLLHTLEIGDRGIGMNVLVETYNKMKDSPFTTDFPKLWKDLGVVVEGRTLHYDDKAPLADIRRAIASDPKKSPSPN